MECIQKSMLILSSTLAVSSAKQIYSHFLSSKSLISTNFKDLGSW